MFCPSIMLLWMWDESNTALRWQWLGLVWSQQLAEDLNSRRDLPEVYAKLPSNSANNVHLWVSSPFEMLVLPFNHVAMDVGWVKHSTICNDWVWFGPNSLLKIATVGQIYQNFMQISLASQPTKSSCESPHHLKCLFCPSIMLLWMWDESNTALLAMIGSGLVPTARWRSQQ